MDNILKYIFLKTNFLNNKTNSLLLLFLLSILWKNIQYDTRIDSKRNRRNLAYQSFLIMEKWNGYKTYQS